MLVRITESILISVMYLEFMTKLKFTTSTNEVNEASDMVY
jgi:hypothetical protein